ncbi:response regulator transcription factor [Planktotalea sp.]|uniref:response regulator transcription factor n=1 Tax=Planktotalea sp. TaxID=2029877 RepID=UPI003D6AD9C9
MAISLLFADDHAIFLQGLVKLADTLGHYDVCAICKDGFDVEKALVQKQPDVAILDVSMPGPGISRLVELAQSLEPPVPVVLLTMHRDLELLETLFKLGAAGYVLKDDAFEELDIAIGEVASGGTYICASMIEVREQGRDVDQAGLTKREIECLQLAAAGATSKAIARKLGLTERTVQFHMSNTCSKLGAKRRAEAVAKALALGLVAL